MEWVPGTLFLLSISLAKQTHTSVMLKRYFPLFNAGILLSTASSSVPLCWGLSTYTTNTFSEDAEDTGPQTTL